MSENRIYRPLYDEENDISCHGATDIRRCYEMERKYGWKLIGIERIDSGGLQVDCIFKGKTEFPPSIFEEEGEDDA
jgi:hypothetical protein